MIESFVDLTYRGLSLGRRVKLSQVRPSTGYLETPAPMPVGTLIHIATDDGLSLEATVSGIHEQTGGSDKPPGMIVKPNLAGEVAETWWRARVAYPEEDRPAQQPPPAVGRAASKPITVRPRSHTVQEPVAAPAEDQAATDQAATDVIPTLPIGPATTIMPAVDQELLEQLSRSSSPEMEQLVRSTGEHDVVDDGKMTTVMDAIDPAALGLLLEEDTGNHQAVPDDKKSGNGNSGAVKKRRKKR